MALPQVDKPDIDDQVRDIISDILENSSYLDSSGKASKVVTFTRDWTVLGTGIFSQTVTGVGFNPSVVFLFSSFPDAYTISLGVYMPSLSHKNICLYFDYLYHVIGTIIRRLLGGYCIRHYPTGYTGVSGQITSTNADGFVVAWVNPDITGGTTTTIALCLK